MVLSENHVAAGLVSHNQTKKQIKLNLLASTSDELAREIVTVHLSSDGHYIWSLLLRSSQSLSVGGKISLL